MRKRKRMSNMRKSRRKSRRQRNFMRKSRT